MRPPSEGVFAFCHNPHPGTNPAGAGARRPPVGISRPTAGYRRGACTCPRRRRLRSLCASQYRPWCARWRSLFRVPSPTSFASPQGRPSGVRYHLVRVTSPQLFFDG